MKVNQSTLADDIFISVETLLPTCSFPTYHAHNVYEIYILNSGERNTFIGSKLYHTSPGVVAMIRPHIPHRSFGNTPYSGICVEFSKGYLDEQLSSRERTEVLQCFIQPVISLPEMYLKELWCNAEKVIKGKIQKKEYLLSLAKILEEFQSATDMARKTSAESDASPISNYLQEHYKEIHSLEELTTYFRVSKSYLCRIFRKQTGLTIVEYINRLKVEEAYKLLQETELSIHEVSMRCGFDTVIYFNRVFRRIMGVTPKDARKIARDQWTYI